MINKKLKSIVLRNRRLIIPSIGAFLTKETDDNKKKIIFSSFLKYDDALLKQILSKEENISEEDAQKEINSFVNHLIESIANEENFTIENFGYFTKDAQGGYAFVVENTEEETKIIAAEPTVEAIASSQESETTIDELKNDKEEDKEENKINEPIITPIVSEQEKTDKEQEEQTTANKESEETSEPAEQIAPIIIPPVAKIETHASKISEQSKEKKKKETSILWIVLIILALLLLLSLLYIFNNRFKNAINSLCCNQTSEELVDKPTNEQKPTAIIDSADIQQAVNDSISNNTTQENTQDTIANKNEADSSSSFAEKQYQVVIGCFEDKEHANMLINSLATNGINARISSKKIGALFAVIADESDDKKEAEQILKSCQQLGHDAWIRKNRR